MADLDQRPRADRSQLQQVITGLTEGVVLVDPDGTIAWANGTALAMHGAENLDGLGSMCRAVKKPSTGALALR